MIFSSYSFLLLFLPIVLAGYYAIKNRPSFLVMAWLVVCSLFFYAYWNVNHLVLILVSILCNYLLSAYVSKDSNNAKLFLAIGISGNLLLLGYFKYANFFLENLHHLGGFHYQAVSILLPLAISFFTFQQIAYLVDLYRGEIERPSLLHYMLCILFFPHLIAGPIVRVREFMPQFLNLSEKKTDINQVGFGVSLLLTGLFKKLLLADNLGVLADSYFAKVSAGNKLDYVTAWIGALAYTFQIYLDFSAYSEMAIGIALLFGISLPINFQFPYHSTSIVDFWRRWHITLSRFLRDYLYIPLGGNRKGKLRRNLNLMLTMILGGLWHGAGWNFIFWGTLHGVYLMVSHGFESLVRIKIPAFLGWMLTFLAAVTAWVFFRSANLTDALHYLQWMVSIRHVDLLWKKLDLFTGAWFIVLFAAIWILFEPKLTRYRNSWGFAFFVSVTGFIAFIFLGEEQKFIYFNF